MTEEYKPTAELRLFLKAWPTFFLCTLLLGYLSVSFIQWDWRIVDWFWLRIFVLCDLLLSMVLAIMMMDYIFKE